MNLMVLAALVAAGCSSDESASASPALLGQELIDAGSPSVADGGAPATPTTAVSGSAKAAGCFSYTRPEDDGAATCNGYYCGVTEAQIAESIPANPVCALEPADICEGTLTAAVATCTRSVVIAHLGDPIEPLRPLIQDCVFQNESIKAKVSEGCVGCFLNVAICAASNCLVECLADSPSCDACRQKAKCEEPVFACGGLPSPF